MEHDHRLRYSIAKVLENLGLDVDVAEAERDAIELGSVRRYCAVLVDVLLPTIDRGQRVIGAISKAHPTVPVFVLSDAELEPGELSGQVRAIYKKPLDVNNLARMVRKECFPEHPDKVIAPLRLSW